MAALVHAATAFVSAAVLSTHLSCSDGLAVGPTCSLNRSMSEKRPAVLTSDCLILNFASAGYFTSGTLRCLSIQNVSDKEIQSMGSGPGQILLDIPSYNIYCPDLFTYRIS